LDSSKQALSGLSAFPRRSSGRSGPESFGIRSLPPGADEATTIGYLGDLALFRTDSDPDGPAMAELRDDA
jgi:hypothetical protein